MCVTWCVSLRVAVLPASAAAEAPTSRHHPPVWPPAGPGAHRESGIHIVFSTQWGPEVCGPLGTRVLHRHRQTHARTHTHTDGLQKHTHERKSHSIFIKRGKKEQRKKSSWSSRVKSSRKLEPFEHTCTSTRALSTGKKEKKCNQTNWAQGAKSRMTAPSE